METHVVWRDGGWFVGPRSYPTAHEAQDAARDDARERGEERIWVHDRYHRVRAITLRRGAC
jgi:hypothetical protein